MPPLAALSALFFLLSSYFSLPFPPISVCSQHITYYLKSDWNNRDSRLKNNCLHTRYNIQTDCCSQLAGNRGNIARIPDMAQALESLKAGYKEAKKVISVKNTSTREASGRSRLPPIGSHPASSCSQQDHAILPPITPSVGRYEPIKERPKTPPPAYEESSSSSNNTNGASRNSEQSDLFAVSSTTTPSYQTSSTSEPIPHNNNEPLPVGVARILLPLSIFQSWLPYVELLLCLH